MHLAPSADAVYVGLDLDQWNLVTAALNLDPRTRDIAGSVAAQVLNVLALRDAADIADAEYDFRSQDERPVGA